MMNTIQLRNPHSRTHSYGWETEAAIEKAREHIANLIHASSPKEIIFTSGATESNNMVQLSIVRSFAHSPNVDSYDFCKAIKGVARFYGKSTGKKHVITTQTEHKCVPFPNRPPSPYSHGLQVRAGQLSLAGGERRGLRGHLSPRAEQRTHRSGGA